MNHVLCRVLGSLLMDNLEHLVVRQIRTVVGDLLHPIVVEIGSEANTESLSVHHIVGRAIAHQGRVRRIRTSKGVHVLTLLKSTEHRSRMTSFEIEHHLLVLLVLVHLVDGLYQNLFVQI